MYMNTRELVYTLTHITHCTTQVEDDRRDHVVKGSKLKNETQLSVSWKSKCQIKGRGKSQVKFFLNNSSISVVINVYVVGKLLFVTLKSVHYTEVFVCCSHFISGSWIRASPLYYILTVSLQASIGI